MYEMITEEKKDSVKLVKNIYVMNLMDELQQLIERLNFESIK